MAVPEDELLRHLRARGLVAADVPLQARPLTGGVSSDVYAVVGPGLDVVVKRACGRLRVADEWLADEERLVTEGWALRVAADLQPGAVPRVLDLDPSTRTLVLERAPRSWREWRAELLAGRVDPAVGELLGRTLAGWHEATRGETRWLAGFADKTAFVQLRIDPFHRVVAARHPDLAPLIEAVVERLLARADCLVHGDFSPKNVLVGDDRVWVLDWEVAHLGDPLFDLAYLLCHLTLKAIHLPAHAARCRATAARFLAAYGAEAGEELGANVACLLLARVDGKSPADYLTPLERERVRALGRELLHNPTLLEEWT